LPVDEQLLRPDAFAICGGVAFGLADEVVEVCFDFRQGYHRQRVVRRQTCRRWAWGERRDLALPAPNESSKVTRADAPTAEALTPRQPERPTTTPGCSR